MSHNFLFVYLYLHKSYLFIYLYIAQLLLKHIKTLDTNADHWKAPIE